MRADGISGHVSKLSATTNQAGPAGAEEILVGLEMITHALWRLEPHGGLA
jgi:hypothetical protein